MQWSTKWRIGCLLLSLAACSCASYSFRPHFTPTTRPVRHASSRPAPQPDLAIRQVQGILHEQGYNPGPIDGLMGQKTRAALRQFQLEHQLPKTGQIDPATKAALLQ